MVNFAVVDYIWIVSLSKCICIGRHILSIHLCSGVTQACVCAPRISPCISLRPAVCSFHVKKNALHRTRINRFFSHRKLQIAEVINFFTYSSKQSFTIFQLKHSLFCGVIFLLAALKFVSENSWMI